MSKYDLLNPMQKEAVFCTEGPLLILAGAGSGKTRVLIHRIAYLIEEKKVNPWNIMAITFTNKAAKEMRERVDSLIGEGGNQVWVSTFHSTCVRILRRYSNEIGFDRYFTIYDTDDSKKVIRECMKELNVDFKQYKESGVLAAINSAKNEFIPPHLYLINVKGNFRQEIYAKVYSLYQEKLKKSNALDFGDLLVKTVELFSNHPKILKEYQDRFEYIMVDEYQDTNAVQFKLINQLSSKHKNLCVVGDDDQSIYKFRGADISNILDFEKTYPKANVIKLEQNYRSTGNILEAANQVIRNNEGRKHKKLWTEKEAGEKIVFKRLNSEKEEAQYVAEEILKGIEKDKKSYKDYAILYRTNAQSRVLEESLVKGNIPYKIVGGTSFYQRKEIKDILAYLRIIENSTDDLSVKRIINVPRRGIGEATIEKVNRYASENNISFFEALGNVTFIQGLTRANKKVTSFFQMIIAFKDALEKLSLVDTLKMILEKTEYKKELVLENTDESKDRLNNIEEFVSKLADYEKNAEEPTLNGFLEEVSLIADIDNYDETNNMVILMTLHSAKGLEFPFVFLTGLEEGLFPSYMTLSSGSTEDLEEERRLCYVGITRAEQKLTLTCAGSRMINGLTQSNPVSRFINEISKDIIERNKLTVGLSNYSEPFSYARKNNAFFSTVPYDISKASKGNIPLSDKATIDYEVDDFVQHKQYGIGKVLKIEHGGKDYQVTINFPSVGEKKFFAGLAKLKKVD